MDTPTPFNSKAKRFFKISELVGKRWPNVTENEIYDWHDIGQKVPVDCNGGMVERAPGDQWNSGPFRGEIELLAFWVFFPDFTSVKTYAELEKEDELGTSASIAYEIGKKMGSPFPTMPLVNQFYLLALDEAKGLAYNKDGKIKGTLFFDEKGNMQINGVWLEELSCYVQGSIEFQKEDLLIKASSIRLLEQIVPEITSTEFRLNKEEILAKSIKSNEKSPRINKRADNRTEKTNLAIVGALLTMLKEETNFESDAQIIDAIKDRYPRAEGLSERSLQDRFSKGKKVLKDVTTD